MEQWNPPPLGIWNLGIWNLGILKLNKLIGSSCQYKTQGLPSFVCFYVHLSRSGDPPWILKRGGLDNSGQRLISLKGITQKIYML